MADRQAYLSVTGCTSPRSANVEMSYSNITGSAVIECDSTTLSIADSIAVDLGYSDEHEVVFRGYVKKIEYNRPDQTVRVTAADELVRAVDYFIASDDPENPFQRNNISSLNLVTDLLALAGVTNVTATEPTPVFTWGTNEDGARFNLQTVSDSISSIASMTGNTIYYDVDADLVQFNTRKPYVVGGDTALDTWTTGDSGNIVSVAYEVSTDKTRNVVKVYGKGNIKASASAANAYLIVDQTIAIAHELLDTQELADNTASVNLTLLNRLTETYTVEILGLPSLRSRQIYHITESFTGADRDIFVYQCTHQIDSESGYFCTVTAVP